MYTLLGLSCLVIKLQHKKWTNVSFAVVFVVKVSCVLKLYKEMIGDSKPFPLVTMRVQNGIGHDTTKLGNI